MTKTKWVQKDHMSLQLSTLLASKAIISKSQDSLSNIALIFFLNTFFSLKKLNKDFKSQTQQITKQLMRI